MVLLGAVLQQWAVRHSRQVAQRSFQHNIGRQFSSTASAGSISRNSTARVDYGNDGSDGQGERVTVLKLNSLCDNPGAVKKGRRIGRGVGSSKGKTSGRGHKGQKARSGGNIHPMFEGGQTKLYKRIPKRGFTNNQHATPMFPLNIQTLQDYIDTGRLVVDNEDDSKDKTDQVKTLTLKDLVDAGVTKRSALKHGIKLLGEGKLRTPVHLEVSRASQSAIAAVEEAGGTITTVHYNKLALRALLQPEKFGHYLPKQAKPPPKLLPYYTNWKNRGYLSPQAQMRKLLRNRPELKEKLDSGNK